MELFGIHKGIIVSAVGEKLSHARIKQIAKACAVSMLEPEQKKIVEKPKNSYKDLPLIERKKLFFNKLQKERKAIEDKGKFYPDHFIQEFYEYWTQTDSIKENEVMQVELVTNKSGVIFNFARRLSTFWGNCSQDQKNEYWKQHEELNKPTK